MSSNPTFQSREAQRLWNEFVSQLAWHFRDLPGEDRADAVSEAKSHVLDAFTETEDGDERERLSAAIDRFGPLETRPSAFRPIVAVTVQYAAILAIGTLGFLTLTWLAMMIAEIFNPDGVGLWVYPTGDWSLSFNAQPGAEEILAAGFIPVMLVLSAIQIGIIYLLHRLVLTEGNPLAAWRNHPRDTAG